MKATLSPHESRLTSKFKSNSKSNSLSPLPDFVPYNLKQHMRDVILCFFFALVGLFGPSKILRLLVGGLKIRPIPYQTTGAGDVILDLTLSNQMVTKVTIPGPFLILTCVWLPLAFLTIITVFHKYSRVPKSSAAISCLLFAIGLEELIVRTLKMYVGRLRPNFYSMCGFNKTTLQCMAPLSLQYEARQSFPSGHASLSFCSMGVLMWFGFGCLTSLFRDINHLKSKIVTLTAFSPLLYSTFVASSRIVDNWHHPSDVIAGAIIGFVSATISSYLWLYPLFLERAYRSQHRANFGKEMEGESNNF